MTLTKVTKFNVQSMHGTILAQNPVEPGANEAEMVSFTLEGMNDLSDWTYSQTAEDNGTAGTHDLTPGLTYNGPNGNYIRVAITNFDTIEGTSAPAAETDKAVLATYINSTLHTVADEAFTEHNSEAAVEFNLDTIVGPLGEGDVVRIGMAFVGEEVDADLSLSACELSIT